MKWWASSSSPAAPGPAPARSRASPTAPCRRARRIADEPVGEAERPGLARRLGEEVQFERLVEPLEHLGPGDPGRALERRDTEAAAGDGGDLERLARLAAQRLQAAADRVADAVRQRQA